jgi:hypothetical protein
MTFHFLERLTISSLLFYSVSGNANSMQNTHRFRGFKLTFADWLKFSLLEELTYEIDV